MEFKQRIVTTGGKKRDYSRLINAIWMPLQEDYKEIIEVKNFEELEKQFKFDFCCSIYKDSMFI